MTSAGYSPTDFPSTHRTWLVTQIADLQEGSDSIRTQAIASLRAHLLERYASPLSAYVQNSSIKRLGEPDEIAHDYLVRMLDDCSGLHNWPGSGRPLRRWLLTGMIFHARGIARDKGRLREFSSLDAVDSYIASEPSAEQAFERAWAREMLEAAFARAAGSMQRSGRDQQWEIFRRHVLDGQPYAPIAADLQINVQQCADATRAASQEVRSAIRAVLIDEGVAERNISSEADAILRSVLHGPTR